MNTCTWIMHDETECGERCEGNTPFCGSHNRQLRKEEQLQKQATEKRKRQIEKAKAKNLEPRKLPNKVSPKMKTQLEEYSEKRINFLNNLENKQCPVFPGYEVSEIHHKKGRVGYADNWARENKITLLLDERFWLAVSSAGHYFIEHHPQLAKDNGWSLSRHENLDQEPITI